MPGIGVNGTGAVFLRRLRAGDLAIIVVVIGGVHVLGLAWSAGPQSAAVRASALHSIVLGCVITGSWFLLLDLRLLATPTSWGRVADPNPN